MAHILKLERKKHLAAVKPNAVVGKHPLAPVSVGHHFSYRPPIYSLARVDKTYAAVVLYLTFIYAQVNVAVAKYPCMAVGQRYNVAHRKLMSDLVADKHVEVNIAACCTVEQIGLAVIGGTPDVATGVWTDKLKAVGSKHLARTEVLAEAAELIAVVIT